MLLHSIPGKEYECRAWFLDDSQVECFVISEDDSLEFTDEVPEEDRESSVPGQHLMIVVKVGNKYPVLPFELNAQKLAEINYEWAMETDDLGNPMVPPSTHVATVVVRDNGVTECTKIVELSNG